MKTQEIKRLIMDAGHCVITTSMRGNQMIGTESALYPVGDGLKIGKDSINTLFDLNEKAREKIKIIEQAQEETAIYPELRVTMNTMEVMPFLIKGYRDFICLIDNGRGYLVDVKKIKAAVGTDDYRQYLLGYTRNNMPVIVIYDGMMWAGVVAPESWEQTENVLKELRKFSFCNAGGWGNENAKTLEEAGEEQTGEIKEELK